MSSGSDEIECRHCSETFPKETGNCPHCGAEIRSDRALIGVAAIGAILAVFSLLSISELWFFFVLGIALALIGGFMYKDKRDRVVPSA